MSDKERQNEKNEAPISSLSPYSISKPDAKSEKGHRDVSDFVPMDELEERSNYIDQGEHKLSLFRKWFWIIPLLVGVSLSCIDIARWNKARAVKYVPPKFEELKIDTGTLSFTNRWRSTGGLIVILPIGGKSLTLSCSGPFSSDACFRVKKNGQWIDMEKDLIGEKATAWWYPDDNYKDFGRIYQLKVGNELIYTYDQQINEYITNFKKGPPDHLRSALVVLSITVAASIYCYFKERKNGNKY